jgi:hypothetical protein
VKVDIGNWVVIVVISGCLWHLELESIPRLVAVHPCHHGAGRLTIKNRITGLSAYPIHRHPKVMLGEASSSLKYLFVQAESLEWYNDATVVLCLYISSNTAL